MRKHSNKDWNLGGYERGNHSYDVPPDDRVLAILMDIRDELQKLNKVFRCHNAIAILDLLRAIKTNTTKKRRKVKK